MPTYSYSRRVMAEFAAMPPPLRALFLTAVREFVEDLDARRRPRTSLRVKRIQGHPGIWEMTWAPDGRATFEYGAEALPGQPHIIWRRIGSHDVFRNP